MTLQCLLLDTISHCVWSGPGSQEAGTWVCRLQEGHWASWSELEIHLLSLGNGGKTEMDGGHFRGGTAAIPQNVVVRSLGKPWWNVTQEIMKRQTGRGRLIGLLICEF